jgi:hypothetical protein
MIGKKKNLNEISPHVLGLVKSLEMWGFTGIGPIFTPLCLYVSLIPVQPMDSGFTPTHFLIKSSDQWVSAIIGPFLSHS